MIKLLIPKILQILLFHCGSDDDDDFGYAKNELQLMIQANNNS